MTFDVFSNSSLLFKHPPFDSDWSLTMAILFDCETMMHFILPYQNELKYSSYFICKVHLINVYVGDINKLNISGSDIKVNRFFKGTIKPIFDELAGILLLDINYDLA